MTANSKSVETWEDDDESRYRIHARLTMNTSGLNALRKEINGESAEDMTLPDSLWEDGDDDTPSGEMADWRKEVGEPAEDNTHELKAHLLHSALAGHSVAIRLVVESIWLQLKRYPGQETPKLCIDREPDGTVCVWDNERIVLDDPRERLVYITGPGILGWDCEPGGEYWLFRLCAWYAQVNGLLD